MPESILKASCTSARHAGSFDCLMASLILITMDNGRGHCAWWQSCTVPNQTHKENNKKRKMYAIKQIKICAEYRDMLPRPRLDLSGTPGLRPIGLSPGSWQTSLGLGSMSRYSAQILICITNVYLHIQHWQWWSSHEENVTTLWFLSESRRRSCTITYWTNVYSQNIHHMNPPNNNTIQWKLRWFPSRYIRYCNNM